MNTLRTKLIKTNLLISTKMSQNLQHFYFFFY
nr:MAG TPA: hypothetical protein [Caudoviricetes sp.]